MGQVIVVASGKGGTGKTTVCAGVASCLAERSQKVLCIDTDIGLRNLDIALGMADSATVAFTEVTEGRVQLDAAPSSPILPTLSLLTAPTTMKVDESAFRQMLLQAREQYDWILLDAPAGVGEGFRLSAAYADQALLVALCDPASIRDAGHTAELLRELGLRSIRLIVNRVSKRLLQKIGTTIDDVMDQVGLPLLGMVPEDPNILLAAVTSTPLIRYTKRGAAIACRNMAGRLMWERIPLMKVR